MIDVEFITQYLVLCNATAHEELIANTGNIALLERAEAIGLLPRGVGHGAANAYRELRRVQHHARLNEEPTQVDPSEVQTERDAVQGVRATERPLAFQEGVSHCNNCCVTSGLLSSPIWFVR
jgi:glutamine synthetase adenylyltransferase